MGKLAPLIFFIIDITEQTAYNENSSLNEKLAILNPFRYRSYYFDIETGLYYLQSRYYDPQVGRFISPDSLEYLDPETIHGLNLFAYCANNPVMAIDPSGKAPKWLGWLITGVVLVALAALTVCTMGAAAPITGVAATIIVGATIGATVGFGTSIITQGLKNGWTNINPWQVLLDTSMGAISGAIGGSRINAISSTILGGVLGFGGSVAGDLVSNKPINWWKAIVMGGLGALLGSLSGAGAGNSKNMVNSINAGESWGAKAFLDFGISVTDKAATQLARSQSALLMANAILGYKAQAILRVARFIIYTTLTGNIL